jgi:hypothetical protein
MRVVNVQNVRALLLFCLAFTPAIALAQDSSSAPAPCVQKPCVLVIDWGPGKTAGSYGADRRYGSGDDFEASIRRSLAARGIRVADALGAELTITLRPKVDTRAMCDELPGTGTSYACAAMSDVAITFASGDAATKAPSALRLSNRCGGDRAYMTMSRFGQYAGDMISWALNASKSKEKRPLLRC